MAAMRRATSPTGIIADVTPATSADCLANIAPSPDKTTSLHARHAAAGARLVPFAGWSMPVMYKTGTAAEVQACRTSVGLFDVSHMGEFSVNGDRAEQFLQSITANDLSALTVGQAQYSLLLNAEGGIKDDIIVYKLAPSDFMVVVNAGCHEKDWQWVAEHAESMEGVSLSDISDATALIAVQGPKAVELVVALAGSDVALIERFHFAPGALENVPVTFSRTGYTGEDGFEIFCPWSEAPKVWDMLAAQGGVPCGLGSRDVLRLEAAYPLYGHELDEMHTPLESGTGWATKLTKGMFVGSAEVKKQKQNGVLERLVGLRLMEPKNAIARDGYSIYNAEGEGPVGNITSGTLSPTVGYGIAMARVQHALSKPGTQVQVDIRGRKAIAEVVKLPFYRNGV